mmetsp:Transcript_34334/g.62810  ORF Transcript_34334/g.62810 Transcript_34334/m.62810 type:complete len:94 (-) Transcript_34334:384-665(-)
MGKRQQSTHSDSKLLFSYAFGIRSSFPHLHHQRSQAAQVVDATTCLDAGQHSVLRACLATPLVIAKHPQLPRKPSSRSVPPPDHHALGMVANQ